MPVEDMFWGDRVGEVRDPYGHCWNIVTKKRVVSDEDMHKGEEEWLEKHHGIAV